MHNYSNLEFVQSRDINDYSIILDGLYLDFNDPFCHTILCWCGIMERNTKKDGKFWEVWLIKDGGMTIGICGLYSLHKDDVKNLWLGWFGILPELRSKGYGSVALFWLKLKAQQIGAKYLYSYVDEEGKPLEFYKRNGFEVVDRVGNFVKLNKLNIEDFENKNDYIIECKF